MNNFWSSDRSLQLLIFHLAKFRKVKLPVSPSTPRRAKKRDRVSAKIMVMPSPFVQPKPYNKMLAK
ncbi:hypothetical protein H6F61_00720 [Cyanobacteria bacterium FACHB-472]|nr:hypothetical protein [Cyanobacteria bacterium FACHB-472]